MPSSVPPINPLTYRGTDIQDYEGIFLQIDSGDALLLGRLEVRGTDVVVPRRTGMIAYNRVRHRRVLRLTGWVRGSGATEDDQRDDFRTKAAAFRDLFDPTLDPGPLVAGLEDGSTGTLQARTLPTVVANQVAPALALVDVELEAVSPDWAYT